MKRLYSSQPDGASAATDDLDPALASLCSDCARDPSLKAFIIDKANGRAHCGICFRTSAEVVVCDIADRIHLANLVRALIRFYYDETDYNEHFGGDNITEILCGENPILDVNHPAAGRPPEEIEWFISELAAQLPAPAYDAGIWIFHQNEGPPLARAISKRESFELQVFQKRLLKENYFALETDVRDILGKIGTRIDVEVPLGRHFYRARIGVASSHLRFDEFDARAVRIPYQGDQLGAPPAANATVGRLNRAGVSFLYLATDADTAACEVRPHPGHVLSVGRFELKRTLRLANFDADIAHFAGSDVELDLFHFVHSTDAVMSQPVVPGEGHRYLFTQLIADLLRQEGYDGIFFKSSVGSGKNLCLFDPRAASYVEKSAQARIVEQVRYRLGDLETVYEPDARDFAL